GVALIVGGIENGEPRLFETDPSGTPYEWQALSIGSDRSDLRDYLEAEYEEGISTDEAVGLALDTLAQSNDGELSPEGVGVATITVDDGYTERSVGEIETILDDHGLLASGEDDESEKDDESDDADASADASDEE
ncbi:proteasome subunit alpha, partial [Halorubrum pallidum]